MATDYPGHPYHQKMVNGVLSTMAVGLPKSSPRATTDFEKLIDHACELWDTDFTSHARIQRLELSWCDQAGAECLVPRDCIDTAGGKSWPELFFCICLQSFGDMYLSPR